MMNVLAALVIAGGYYAWNTWVAPAVVPESAAATAATPAGTAELATLVAERRSNAMVTVTAPVAHVLPDDNEGSRHQRFLLALPSGERVLVAHNIDLAPRVDPLAEGDTVTVRGEFEWNDKGGVIHWTHHDPAARHQDGWIEAGGRTFR